jgi:hypothetical protein
MEVALMYFQMTIGQSKMVSQAGMVDSLRIAQVIFGRNHAKEQDRDYHSFCDGTWTQGGEQDIQRNFDLSPGCLRHTHSWGSIHLLVERQNYSDQRGNVGCEDDKAPVSEA